MPTDLIIIVSSLCFSAFFSGMEIAYVSANKIHIEIEKKQKGLFKNVWSNDGYPTISSFFNKICLSVS